MSDEIQTLEETVSEGLRRFGGTVRRSYDGSDNVAEFLSLLEEHGFAVVAGDGDAAKAMASSIVSNFLTAVSQVNSFIVHLPKGSLRTYKLAEENESFVMLEMPAEAAA